MNTFYIATKNLKKNFSFYSLYLISVAFVITVLFAFTSFSANTVILEKISTDGRVKSMCNIISVFLMIFVLFYMSYSNRFFIRRRTKELGIYALLGYRKATILSLLTFENILICFGAFIAGILLGGFAHKGIVFLINELLHLGINNASIELFDYTAIRDTAAFVFAIVIILTISNGRFLYKTSLMNLVRYEKSAEKKMKLHKISAILGLIMILGGYLVALDIIRGSTSIWITIGFYPMGLLTMFLIVIGTVLFIASFLPYVIQSGKKNKEKFYTSTKIITMPNFIYRIRLNAKTLIMLTLLSAATLTISSVMGLTLYYPLAAVSRIAPSEIEFKLDNEMQLQNVKNFVKEYTEDSTDYTFTKTTVYRATSSSDNLPVEYSIGASKNGSNDEDVVRDPGFECISYSQYIALLNAQGKQGLAENINSLNDNEAILLKYQPDSTSDSETGNQYVLNFDEIESTITVKEVSLDNTLSFANSIGTLIISDNLYQNVQEIQQPLSTIISINGSAIKNNENLYQSISDSLKNSPYLQGHSHRINELLYTNSSTFLLIGFLVILFFIAVGSILYFNNLSAVTDSKSDYEILGKLGYTNVQIKRILRKQIIIFYSIPFLLGLLDCIFATIVYKAGLMQNLLGNSMNQYIPVLIAILITLVIYAVYYLLTVSSCYKVVLKK